MSTRFGEHTLRNLVVAVLGIGLILAAADVLRGTGGRAWFTATASERSADPDSDATLFRGVRVFDGELTLATRDVLISDGLVREVGSDLDAPEGARVIEGDGHTLFPGLIDSHTHAFGPVLRAALMMGVTAELDMFTEPGGAGALRAEQARGDANGRADLFSAGFLATAPSGHGTQFGIQVPTLTAADQADAWVQARVDEGSDYIKIVYESGSFGREIPTLDLDTVEALIEAAHARDLLAVVHVSREADAIDVIEAGADGIVHAFHDHVASDETVAAIAASGAFVVPTLAVMESVAGGPGGQELIADERLAPYISANERTTLETGFPSSPALASVLDNTMATVGRLHAAGVPILAGTDAPNPGTAHGASMHRELELLVGAGLTPAEALAAATLVPAREFRLEGRGAISPGMRADLVLVEGNPLQDITATRAIAGVWKAGHEADRAAYADEVTVASEPAQAAAVSEDGLIANFDDGEIDGAFGSGWMVSTDTMIGGSSTAEMSTADGGADGSAMAMHVTGNIGGGGPAVWAGPMFFPGPGQFVPTDMSAHEGFRFWLRGDGAPVTVMIFAQSLGQMPGRIVVPSTAEWALHEVSFSDFPGADPAGLQAIMFSGSQPGDFEFFVDEFRIW